MWICFNSRSVNPELSWTEPSLRTCFQSVFNHKLWQHVTWLFYSPFNPGFQPDWEEAEATQSQHARHQTGWQHQWRWRGGVWGQRPRERAGCWQCWPPLSCAVRGRAPARVSLATAKSSRARVYPELAWSLSWTAGRWWGSLCCCSSPARWWRQRGRGGRTHTLPEWRWRKE